MSKPNPNNVTYLFPILAVMGMIVGNIVCYNVNDRLLSLPTNLIWIFIIIIMFKKRK